MVRPIVPPEEGPAPDLPDSVIVDLLKREVLLTGAKLHALWYDHVVAERKLRTLKAQLRQVCVGSEALNHAKSVSRAGVDVFNEIPWLYVRSITVLLSLDLF